MKRKENFQLLPKELHQLKYEAISVPQGSVRLVKKTQERKSSTCYLLITKGVTSSSPVPLKTLRCRKFIIHLHPKFKERLITKLPFNFLLDMKSMKISSSEVESTSGVS
ncbi:uncharacterized protein TNCV_2236381 [Trichonephila clavipes]|nr:uncharacterized protein TNCV_2236381 [Trichonephila clavipes]